MPTPYEILAGLTEVANRWIALAIAWHIALAIALAAVALGWRPTHRTASLLITLLPASVAVASLAHGNPFNGIVFAATTVALLALAARDRRGPVAAVPRWSTWGGLALVAFGWVYPHFLTGSPVQYLYAAPVGLVPCPTLSVAIGLALLAGGGGRRAWRLTLAGVGLFYALFGAARLGVLLDLGLLVGATLLAATAFVRLAPPVPRAQPA